MRALIAAIFLLVATAVGAQGDAGQHLLIGEIDVYFGLMPSALASAHPASHPESSMHEGAPDNRHSYHLIVALFDHTTQKRIPDAHVTASVQEIGLGETRKRLEPMRIGDTTSYGAYFDLSGAGPYRVRLEVTRPGRHDATSGQFEYRPQ
jgi:hypothetical protein